MYIFYVKIATSERGVGVSIFLIATGSVYELQFSGQGNYWVVLFSKNLITSVISLNKLQRINKNSVDLFLTKDMF